VNPNCSTQMLDLALISTLCTVCGTPVQPKIQLERVILRESAETYSTKVVRELVHLQSCEDDTTWGNSDEEDGHDSSYYRAVRGTNTTRTTRGFTEYSPLNRSTRIRPSGSPSGWMRGYLVSGIQTNPDIYAIEDVSHNITTRNGRSLGCGSAAGVNTRG